MATAALTTRTLQVTIGNVVVCQDLDISLDAGQSWCILGRNGIGKTTLLHTLAGLRAPLGGKVSMDGMPLEQYSRRAVARRIGILFQDHQDTFPATVLETALMGRHPHLSPWRWEGPEDVLAAEAALAHVGLDGFQQRLVSTLSGGERRRLGIATLLAQDADYWLLDEPTNHLDIHHQISLMEHINTAGRHKARLFVLHDINLAARFADHFLLLLGDGQWCSGNREEMLQRDLLERLYGHPLLPLQGPRGTAWLPA